MREIFNINGKKVELALEGDFTLLQALRENGYTEVKNGCEEGQCGACLVLVDEKPANSCQILAMSVKNREIKTVKGIGTIHSPNVIQESMVEAGAVQCGFCTPGFVIAIYALLKKHPQPTDEQIKSYLDGNLCRCTGYTKIADAVHLTVKKIISGEASL
ncbi:MAG: (2Fe-2S)-binding protein [Candidatus Muiribacteriota bacterium]|jgi:aerobic-type carbon monoxide dehydrogenase small subunit (CoxS/CutS family)